MRALPTPPAEQIAQAQLDAYNAHDLDAFMACFAPDAVVALLQTGEVVAAGREQVRRLYHTRFTENPALHARLIARTSLGDVVVDREEVTGLANGTLHVIAIYEIVGGLIRRVWFVRQQGNAID